MDYKNGKIYAIRSYQTDEVYIGSTCSSLAKRLYDHRKSFRLYPESKKGYMTSFKILQHPDHYIELLELCPCNSKIELHKREGKFIRSNNCVNKMIPGRDMKQYYQDNKERIKQRIRKHYQDNKDVINQRRKQYREVNKDEIKKRKKQYYQDNKDVINQRRKQYYQDNKQKIKCDVCDCMVMKHNYNRHKKSKKHISNISR